MSLLLGHALTQAWGTWKPEAKPAAKPVAKPAAAKPVAKQPRNCKRTPVVAVSSESDSAELDQALMRCHCTYVPACRSGDRQSFGHAAHAGRGTGLL